jgi:hypothetical protein
MTNWLLRTTPKRLSSYCRLLMFALAIRPDLAAARARLLLTVFALIRVYHFTIRNLRCVTRGEATTLMFSSSMCSGPMRSNKRIPSPNSKGAR